MLDRYEEFLKEFDSEINGYFKAQQEYIKCKIGCLDCCVLGEYPFSRLEAEYIMQGFQLLDKPTKDLIRDNIQHLKMQKEKYSGERFLYGCPFLINNKCALYERRGLTCRMYGLAYLADDRITLPNCATLGLNYSDVFDSESGFVDLPNPIKKKLIIDTWLKSPLAGKYELECGEIRPLINWF